MNKIKLSESGKVNFDSSELGSLIFHNAPDPMFVLYVDGDETCRCISVNRAYLDRLGLAEADVIGKRIDEVLPGTEVAATLAKYRLVIERREPIRFEAKANGMSVAQTTLVPILDEAGHCAYVLGIDRDITEFRRAESVERERRIFAETLRDISSVINRTLDLEQVLDQVLNSVGQIVPHDAANILLLESDGCVSVARGRGYETWGWLSAKSVSIDAMLPLKRMIASRCAMAIPDVCLSAEWNARLPGTEWIRAYVGAPLCISGRVIGFINLDSATPGCFNAAHAQQLLAFANQTAMAIENARLHAQVRELAIVDELTGLYNRRGLFQFGEYEFGRAIRNKRPLTAMMLDIDRFKSVNDTYGHAAGDVVLRKLAQCCRENVRDIDMVARYGGEEFVVLLPETDTAAAKKIAERLRDLIETSPFFVTTSERECVIHVTVSIGVTGGHPWNLKLMMLIENADHALYLAKNAGGNQVVVD
ncbi:MAG: diguanylate cyclase [Chloroflexi bacterium]|nr:diguanylate cyclase [Chloroflexota bacterium]